MLSLILFLVVLVLCVSLVPSLGNLPLLRAAFVPGFCVLGIYFLVVVIVLLLLGSKSSSNSKSSSKNSKKQFYKTKSKTPRIIDACGAAATLAMLFVFGVFLFYFNETHQGSTFFPSPCGASGCTRAIMGMEKIPYNPNGFWGSATHNVSSSFATTCVYQECAFAVSNNQSITGYCAQQPTQSCVVSSTGCTCLATSSPSSYPNWGTGLTYGLEPGVSVVDNTTTCPAAGQGPCPLCLAYWVLVQKNPLPDLYQHCIIPNTTAHMSKAQNNTFVCGVVCLGSDTERTPEATQMYVRIAFVLVQIPATYWIVNNGYSESYTKAARKTITVPSIAAAAQLGIVVIAVSIAQSRVSVNPVGYTPIISF